MIYRNATLISYIVQKTKLFKKSKPSTQTSPPTTRYQHRTVPSTPLFSDLTEALLLFQLEDLGNKSDTT